MASLMRGYKIFCLQLFLLYSQSSASLCSQDQSSALLQFKQLFAFMNPSSFHCDYFAKLSKMDAIESPPYCDGRCPSYPKTLFWKEDIDCCSWKGVTCDSVTGHVIGLDLSCGWLHGYIPSNSTLFLLRHLQSLNLAFNDFNLSQISSLFSQFSNLTHLNLSTSGFSGQIPSEISHLSNLVSLDLSSVDFIFYDSENYNIFFEVYNGLTLEKTVLDGLVQNMTKLTELNLDYVDMSTITPRSFMNLSSLLTSLSLKSCRLQGKFPDKISHLSNLVSLDLSSSEFSLFSNSLRLEKTVLDGLVQNLTRLTELNLDYVDMSTITPTSFTNLSSSLTLLSLNDCGLQGKFIDKIFHLRNLKLLSLAHNFDSTVSLPKVNWSGPIPIEYLDVSNMILSRELSNSIGILISLKHLNLFSCSLVGSVPTSLGNLTQLTFLDLSFNSFSGPIPSFLSKISLLRVLRLSENNFTGEFLDIFVNMTQLSYLDLGNNQLVGPLPFDGSEFQNLVVIDLFNNSLNGSLPSWLFSLPLLECMDLSFNQLTGSLKDGFQSNSLKIIHLYNNRLDGSVPSSIFKIVNLIDLDLSSNNFNGSIELYKFAKLKKLKFLDLSDNHELVSTTFKANSSFHQLRTLFLSSCNISEFPDILRRANQLQYLDLSNNKIHGQIPDLIQGTFPILPPNLILFSLSNNKLTGKIPLFICNMSVIEVLNFSNNSLSGTIPECLGNISSLHVLDLQMNNLHGNIPETFAKGNHLRTLDFNNNELEGSIPQTLINCGFLEVLDLGNNKINDRFPYWLGNLSMLQVLVLRSNNFYGSVYVSIGGAFPMLRIFDLSNNNFNGVLPTSYFENLKAMMNLDEAKKQLHYMGETYYQDSILIIVKGLEITLEKIITTFTTIDFSKNNFQGEIPESVAELHSLRLLNLSQNSLTGHIPKSLGNLKSLESLDLSSNKLVGEIPLQMISLTFLAFLNLSQNRLVGPIPRGNQFDTFENNSYSENPGLCGFPLPNRCDIDDPPQPNSSIFHDENHNTSSWFDWKVIMMGYGCGLLLGLFIGYSIFLIGKPKWFLRMINRAIIKCESGRRKGRTKRKWCS